MNAVAGKSLVVQLIEVVNDEVRVFHDLLELLNQEQAAIVEDRAEAIEAVAAQKVEMVETARHLEGERLSLVRQLSESLNMAPGSVDLARLIDAVESHHGAELARMREALLEVNQKIRDTNENNAFLIRQSLRYTERCLDILTGHPQDRGLYGKFGRTRPRGGADRSVLNRTA
jgi:flagellar biosynthesis/type III secretory pathway chaperone